MGNTALRPITFSASRLKTWSQCPLAGKFKYIDHLPESQNAKASYGSILHKALEVFNTTGNRDEAIDLFKDLWQNPEKVGLTPDWWPKRSSYQGLLDQGVEVLKRYAESLQWDSREVIASEHHFLVPFGKYSLNGFVDLLEIRKSGNGRKMLRVIDYKGGSWSPNATELLYDIQFTVYLYAVDQPEFWMGVSGNPDFPGLPHGEFLYDQYRDLPRRAIWFHLNNMKEIDAGKRDEEDFFRLYRLCDEVVRSQEAGIFVPRIGESCSLCSFTKECGVEVPPKDEEAWL